MIGIELNQTILEVSSEHFGAFQGGVLSRPEVTLVHADGRSYLEHAQSKGERFSLIQMSGADTYSAGNAGALHVQRELPLHGRLRSSDTCGRWSPAGSSRSSGSAPSSCGRS